MSSFDYFWYLALGTMEFLGYFAFITIPVALVACGVVAWAWGRASVRRGRIVVACAVPAIIPVCLLTIGVAFVRPERTAWANGVHPPVPWFVGMSGDSAESAITAMLWMSLPLVGILSWWVAPRLACIAGVCAMVGMGVDVRGRNGGDVRHRELAMTT